MPTQKRTAKRPMSEEHKAALAEGRQAGRAVRSYLEALEQSRPKRGRKRSREGMEQRVADLSTRIPETEPLQRVALIQQRIDLEKDLAAGEEQVDLEAMQHEFEKHAAVYSERKGISYAAWREAGVPASALKAAGIRRSA